ncbi:hypothetical protein F5Y15DRAFT_71507 [Xylariaceae sp. FL0016]|nr:hypothetical protein F5Y15DRAFT_71507 [Xylariaceae sp. FL0016]
MRRETADLVIIGAGIYGVETAKTYLQVHPDQKVVLLDGGESMGGTWSRERVYPSLHANNTLGWLEFPDMPMTPEEFDVKPGEHIKGAAVRDYLVAYAKRFQVFDKIRLRTKVDSVERAEEGGWLVSWTVSSAGASDKVGTIHAKRLVVATGHTCEALLPRFKGQASFQKPLFHTKDWSLHYDLLTTAHEALVLGAGKSAYDAAYMFADAGIKTHMVVRASGHGPAWMCKYEATPLKLGLEGLAMRRVIGLLSPCMWGHDGEYGFVRRFLHGTWLGRKITKAFWGIVHNDVVQLSGIMDHPGSRKLLPWTDFFWSGTSCSILNHDKDFYQFVRDGLVEVHVADIEELGTDSVRLSTGETLKVDAMVCSTTWKDRPSINFLPSGSEAKLGLPHFSPDPDPEGHFARADRKVLETFPLLHDQPVINRHLTSIPTAENEPFDPTTENMPYLLYRFMVPPAYLRDRSLVFLGVPLTFNQGQMAPTQALWATAYFDGHVEVPEEKAAMEETILHARHARWRAPAGYGAKFPDWIFDTMPCIDMMYKDIGVFGWRKTGWKDLFAPYMPADFRGVVGEYVRKYREADK